MVQYADWQSLDGKNFHIAVMSQPFLSYVLNGSKTIESRFSLHRIAPYQKVTAGDIVLMKAGPIIGCFTATWVKDFDLATHNIAQIATEYGQAICGDAAFWQQQATKRYATLVGIRDVRRLTPVRVSKPDRRGWLAL